ncbi:MAG: threonine/serine dehydratase [Planctomycetaceae bacterium]|nr:threonine/serine dehydratase [Planctomycetaceae bacterium]
MVDFKLVEHVRAYVTGLALRTPVVPSDWLGEAYGGQVWLKCENLQLTGSFKVRGPLARFPWLTKEERMMGVLCASGGNHGKGLAWAAKHYGVHCTVCVPKTIAEAKEKAIRKFGAHVVKTPFSTYDENERYAMELAKKTGRVWVSSDDDDHIQAGNGGTTALEIFEDLRKKPDAIVVPVGGGALGIGMGVVAREISPRTKIIGVNTDASPGMYLSRKEQKAQRTIESKPTIADGLEGGISERAYERSLKYIDEMVVVKESHLKKTVAEMLRRHRVAIEGAAAVGPAAVLEGLLPKGLRRICIVITGSNIETPRFKEIIYTHL